MKRETYQNRLNDILNENIKNIIPDYVRDIVFGLEKNGYEAWIVGGSVRDLILDREISDWDLTTNATPNEIAKVFPNNIPTGIKHGTLTVIVNKNKCEITTLRIDGEYKDFRRPENVVFTSSITEDLSRRDFTINSMALSLVNNKLELIDPYNGLNDIEIESIKAVGESIERFSEDPLRMLRAVRFSAQLGFNIESKTCEGIIACSNLIKHISPERIRVELEKILISERPETIFKLNEFDLLEYIMPELVPSLTCYQTNVFHLQTVAEHTEKALIASKNDRVIRWAVLFHDIGKPTQMTIDEKGITHFYGHEKESARISTEIMKRLRFDNLTIETVTKLILLHDLKIEISEKNLRRAVFKISEELFPYYLELKKADVSGQNEIYSIERIKAIKEIEDLWSKLKEKDACLSLKKLALNGKDLLDMGFKPGPEIGKTLTELLELVIELPENNKKDFLLERAKSLLNKQSFN